MARMVGRLGGRDGGSERQPKMRRSARRSHEESGGVVTNSSGGSNWSQVARGGGLAQRLQFREDLELPPIEGFPERFQEPAAE